MRHLWQDHPVGGVLSAFVEAWPGAAAGLPRDFEAQLASVCEAARAAWPDLGVDDTRFVQYLAQRLAPQGDPADHLAELRAADLYLAHACADGVPAALTLFEERLLSHAPAFLKHLQQPPAFVDDVLQLLRTRLLIGSPSEPPRIAQYAGRGPLSSWVGIAAQRTAISLIRGEGAHSRAIDEAMAQALPAGKDPELDYLKARYRKEFRAAFSEAIAALPARDRLILRLFLVDNLSHERIGTMYQVNQSTVTRWIARAREAILRDTQTSLRNSLRVETSEFESLAALVGSELDLSLTRLLGENVGG
jgi:RNA polymerase sigma-70 factor, ECF subfamily